MDTPDLKYRVVYDACYFDGRHKYIIERWGETFDSRMARRFYFLFMPKRVNGWERLGGGYFFDDKEEALEQCDNLNKGCVVVSLMGRLSFMGLRR